MNKSGRYCELPALPALPYQESDFAFFQKYTFCGSLLRFNQITTAPISSRQKDKKHL